MTTVILGANGRLGRMIRHFAGQDTLGWRSQSRTANTDIQWSGDFDAANSGKIFQENATLINLIGDTGADPVALNDTNVTFVKNLLMRAADAGVAHVMLASSAAVYGAQDLRKLDECTPLAPLSAYGESKQAMEIAATEFAASHDGPAITILRIANVAGADVLGDIAASGKPMALHRFADGTTPIRSYISPRDLFLALREIAQTPTKGVRTFNIAHPQAVSLEQMLVAYKRHLYPTLTWADAPAPDTAIARVVLATDRIGALTSFATHTDPADAFAADLATYHAATMPKAAP